MKRWFGPILSGIASAATAWLLKIGTAKMPDIAFDFLRTFWPLLVGGTVGLIVWNVQFFRNYKRDKDAEFRSWLTTQETNWEGKFNAVARKAENEWEIMKTNTKRYFESNEGRLLSLERAISQKDSDVQSKRLECEADA